MLDQVNQCALVSSDELTRSIWIQVNYLKSQFALLPEVVNDFKVVRVVRVQVVMDNFCVVYLQPVSLVRVPLHLQYDLCI